MFERTFRSIRTRKHGHFISSSFAHSGSGREKLMDKAGILSIYELANTAGPGEKPREKLVKIADACYERRSFGVSRIYGAKMANAQFDAVVRVHGMGKEPERGQYVIIAPAQFRIDAAQPVAGSYDWDLTLIRQEDHYDVNYQDNQKNP